MGLKEWGKEPAKETKKNWLQVCNVTEAKRVSRILSL